MAARRFVGLAATGILCLSLVLQAPVAGQTRDGANVTELKGQVVTSEGHPVRRAHVVASGPITVSTDTDPDGVFRLAGLTKGTYTLAPTKTGFVETGPSVVNVVEGVEPLDIRVVMAPAGVITGRVLDRGGSALVDSVVTLRKEDAVVSRQTTDDRGVFRFHTLRAGTYGIWATVQSRDEAQAATVIPGRTVDLELVSSSTASADNPAIPTLTPGPPDGPQLARSREIRGRITSAETGSPLSRVTVRLIGGGLQRTAETGESGRFLFGEVPDGRYTIVAGDLPNGLRSIVTAGGSKYVGLFHGQSTPQDPQVPVFLVNGRSIADANIELPLTKTLAGRVVDEFGDPAPDVTMVIVQHTVAAGKTILFPLSGGAVTDDIGEFRIRDLPPGAFFLMALSGPFATANVLGGPAGPQSRGYGFALTFFPGTALPAQAQPVRIEARGTTAPVTFALVPTEMGTVAGRVVDRSGTPARGANVMLLQLHGGDIRMAVPARATADGDGFFSVGNVPVGSFVAQAFGASGFASGTVVVSPRETARLELALAPPSAVRGQLVFDGTIDPSLVKKIRIWATPTDFVRSPIGVVQPRSVILDDGTFDVSGLRGINKLNFDVPLPWILVSISSGGDDMTDRPIDSSAGDIGDLRVRFAPTASTVVCKVSDTSGRRLLTGFVLIFPQNSSQWTYPSSYVRGLVADANGDFTASALPPGLYRAVPFEAVPRPDWMNPGFLETLRVRGEGFTVGPGESVTVRLELRK